MRYVVASRPNPNDDLAIPAFLDRREFFDADVLGDGNLVTFRIVRDVELYVPGGPRVWATPGAPGTSAARRAAEEAPGGTLYVANRAWPVQVVSKGKRPQNLALHADWDTFQKFHDFDDFPVERTFSGGDMTYVVVRNEAEKNDIVMGAMKGVALNTRPDVMEQNGVKRPKTGSITASAWASFDDMREKNLEFKDVFARLQEAGMNPSTIRTQYSHWKKFNGISK